ncbi:MAG: tyrosine--tRNA ligase [Acidimicrobiales bacterium]
MPVPAFDVLADFEARGLVQDTTDRAALARLLASPPVTVYHGIDPTADSLHVGHLIGVLALRRFQLAGHRPIALTGGATGMIGDPGGRSEERNLLDSTTLGTNLAAIEGQLRRLLFFEGGGVDGDGVVGDDVRPGERPGALLVDNAAWTAGLNLLAFLRDVGKHVTVNQMMAKESVRSRLEGTYGISFTEFSYMLLQANDYLWLHDHHSCDLQVGGSDQWGNITAGVDLVRRRRGDHVHGLTWPLLTRVDGTKFGKSQGDNIWLDPAQTSPYAFFQHWMQTGDADLGRYLLQLTLLQVTEVDEVVAAHTEAPGRRTGQRRLAFEVTALVHGADQAVAAQAAAAILFGTVPDDIPYNAYLTLEGEVATTVVTPARLTEGVDLAGLLAETGLATSLSDARRSLDQGGIYINGQRVDQRAGPLTPTSLRLGRWIILRRGKRHHHLIRVSPEEVDTRAPGR